MIYLGYDEYGTLDVFSKGIQYTYFKVPEKMQTRIKKLIKAGVEGKAWQLLKIFECYKREVKQ